MRKELLLLAAIGTLAGAVPALAQNTVAQSTENSGALSADLGASLFRVGDTGDGGSAFIAHGYAAAQLRPPGESNPSVVPGATSVGAFEIRLENLCVTEATAEILPVALMEPSQAPGDGAQPNIYVTGVKVETKKDECGLIHVSYGMKMPKGGTLTQVGYTLYLTGKADPAGGKPKVLPRTPM